MSIKKNYRTTESTKVYEVISFWYVKVYIFSKFIQYTTYWDKQQMLKKFPSDKINVTENTLFFLLRPPSHHSFTFNSQFLYGLKYNVHLSETVIFHFQFCFVFMKFYIFVQQKPWTLWLSNVIISFKIKAI